MVKIRLSGPPNEVEALAALLEVVAEVTRHSRDYPNRGGSGVRRYLDLAGIKPDLLISYERNKPDEEL